jgi:hypothetical protein
MATGLSPVLALQEHSGTTDVFGGTLMPVTFTIGTISERNLQIEPRGARLSSWTDNDFCVGHGFCHSWFDFF